MKSSWFWICLLFCGGLMCLPALLSAQTPKNPPAKTGKSTATPPKTAGSAHAGENPYFIKLQVDSLRKAGKSNADITALLNGRTAANGKVISKADLVKGMRKTPARTNNPTPGAANTPPPANTSVGTGPFVLTGLTEAEADDAAEIVGCLTPLNASGRLGYDDLSIIVEEFRIPSMAMLLLVLDRAGEFDDPSNIFAYVEIIRPWLLLLSRDNTQRAITAPAGWFGQFPAFFKVYAYKGLPATRAYEDFANSGFVFPGGWIDTYFRGMDMKQSANAVANGIATAYGYSRNRVLREVLHQDGEVQQKLTNMVRRHGGPGAQGESAISWAVILKMNDVPDGQGGFYPGYTSAEATALLINAGYTRQDVVNAIHSVYQ